MSKYHLYPAFPSDYISFISNPEWFQGFGQANVFNSAILVKDSTILEQSYNEPWNGGSCAIESMSIGQQANSFRRWGAFRRERSIADM